MILGIFLEKKSRHPRERTIRAHLKLWHQKTFLEAILLERNLGQQA